MTTCPMKNYSMKKMKRRRKMTTMKTMMILITSKEMKKQLESARFRIKISKNLSLVVNLTEDHRRF